MPPRAYVLIFVCWALLAIITPTLVFWSATANSHRLDSRGDEDDDLKGRRMMQGYLRRTNPRVRPTQEVPAPAPSALAPSPSPNSQRLWPIWGDT